MVYTFCVWVGILERFVNRSPTDATHLLSGIYPFFVLLELLPMCSPVWSVLAHLALLIGGGYKINGEQIETQAPHNQKSHHRAMSCDDFSNFNSITICLYKQLLKVAIFPFLQMFINTLDAIVYGIAYG